MTVLRRIAAVAGLELLRLTRSPIAVTLLILVPALQVLLFGYAIRPGGGAITVAIAAERAEDGETVAHSLDGIANLVIVRRTGPAGSADAAVTARAALVGIEVPELPSLTNEGARLRPLRIVIDACNAPLVGAAAPTIEAAYWRALATRSGIGGPGYRIERRFNPDARADWSFLPALIGVTVMISMIMLGTLSLAREREAGSWEVLLSLPLGSGAILAGKLVPYVLIGSVQGAMVLAIGIGLFALPARGDLLALLAIVPVFAAAHVAIGLAIAARAATQLAALQGAVAFYLPAMLLSGFLYPFESLPRWAQLLGEAFPLTHFIRVARGVLLRGDGGAAVLAQAWPIVAMLIAALVVARLGQGRHLS